MRKPTVALLILPFLGACAANRPFTPARADTESSQGFAAAQYEIRTGPTDWGAVQVKVWTGGVDERVEPAEGKKKGDVTAHASVWFEVMNDWNQPVRLSLESARLTALLENGREVPAVSPIEASASEPVGHGEEKTFKMGFAVSAKPDDLRSFEVRWTVRSGDDTYTRKTRFVREAEGDGYYYMPYDPWFYGSVGASSLRGRGRSRWGTGVSIGIGVGN